MDKLTHLALGMILSGMSFLHSPIDTPDVKKGGPQIPPLPSQPVVPAPTPLPGGMIPLPAGVELLITDNAKFRVVAFPENMVKIKRLDIAAGKEHTLSGTFIDPTDASKITDADQTFVGPCYVYRIRSAGVDGTCELYVYEGTEDGIRVKVACGKGPQPPPIVPPIVPPVVPVDPFTQAVQDAYNNEPATFTDPTGKVWNKADCLSKLAAVYRQTAVQIAPSNTPAPWKTYGEMFNDMETASRSLLPQGAIPGVRKVIGSRLNDSLKPTTAKPIDRNLTYSEFNAVADAMKGVK